MFTDKVVFITGGASGLGRVLAEQFLQNHAKVCFTYRHSAEKAKDIIGRYEGQAFAMPADASLYDEAVMAVEECIGRFGQVDVLVNNAAGAKDGSLLRLEQEGFDFTIRNVLHPVYNYCKAVCPYMVGQGSGKIINIGSIAGDAAYPGGSVYCATKAAVKALSDGLRIDLVDTPLRVTNIKPGLVETNFSVVRFRGDKEKADNVYKGIRPLTGDDIAETVYFAASVPEYMQIAEMLVMPTNQATGTIVSRK